MQLWARTPFVLRRILADVLLTLVPSQAFPVALTIFVVISALAARWVYVDSQRRSSGDLWERLAWSVGTLVALPVFLPIYLIAARPPGRLTPCSHCGQPTISHRAVCLHCGSPIEFESAPAMWGLGEVIGVAVVFVLSLPLIAATLGITRMPTLAELSAFAVAQDLLFVVLAVYVVRVRYGLDLTTLGIRLARWPLLLAVGAAVGAATIPLSELAERAAILVIGLFIGVDRAESMADAEHARDVLTGILRGPLTRSEIAWILVLVCIIVPIGEEIFFRGFLYTALRRWGVTLASALSAIFFGAVHQQIVHFLPIFLLGVVLALLFERMRSLIPGMIVHGLNNLVAILSVLFGWNI